PATLSHRIVTGLLKNELGYEGVVFSDDLEMQAVAKRWGVVDAGIKAIEAGCDALLVCSDVSALFELRDALADRADRDTAFAERLADAASRTLRLRRTFPVTLSADLAAEASLEEEIRQALENR